MFNMLKVNPALINVHPSGRWTAIMQAAKYGTEGVVKDLLKLGADPYMLNKLGGTNTFDVAEKVATETLQRLTEHAFLNFAKYGDFKRMFALLEASNNKLVNVHRDDRWTAIMQAAYHDSRDTIEKLLMLGADPHMRVGGQSAFDVAKTDHMRMWMLSKATPLPTYVDAD